MDRFLNQNSEKSIKILMVCLGNICRSPTAHGVLEAKVLASPILAQRTVIDSCGTGDWHIGKAPDQRSQTTALKKNYDLSRLRARRLDRSDFVDFNYIFAMDNQNLVDIKSWEGSHNSGPDIELFLAWAFEGITQDDPPSVLEQYEIAAGNSFEVPDPYYGGEAGFDQVLNLIETACDLTIRRLELACSG